MWNWWRKIKDYLESGMKTIQVSYTVIDTLKVPEDWTEEQINKLIENNWIDMMANIYLEYNDVEWNIIEGE